MSKKKAVFIALAASLAYFCLYGWNLQFPPEKIFDEVYQVTTAQEILARNGYTERAHPPLIMILMAAAIGIFGDISWAWRIVSLFAGWGCLVLIVILVLQWTQNFRLACFSALLLGLDGLFFTFSRTGVIHQGMLFWMLAAIVCFCQHTVTRQWSRPWAFLWAGICWGLAVSSRWVAAGTPFLMLVPAAKLLFDKPSEARPFLKDLFPCFFLSAVAAYLIPFLIVSFIFGFDWSSTLDFQNYMLHYHLNLTEDHTYASKWWGWPFLLRPVWLYFREFQNAGIHQINVRGILCIGNPAVTWLLIPALCAVLYRALKRKNWFYGFIAAGFLIQWLQWIPVKRVTFFHYFLTAMPFGVMMLAALLDQVWQKGIWGKRAVWTYLLLIAAMFFCWYPLYSGLPISETDFYRLVWFSRWI